MAVFRHLNELARRASTVTSRKLFERSYAAAALAMADSEEWEIPLPVLQDMHGQRTRRGPQWIFLGSPGAGKGTYASRLAKLLNVPHISMGNLLRKEAAISSSFSKQLDSLAVKGKLVSDELIFRILSKRLEQKAEFEETGFILEGFPRTINQAEVLDEVADIDLVIHLKLREDMMLKCFERGVCTECGCSFSGSHVDIESCPKVQLLPPPGCLLKMVSPLHGTLITLRERLHAYSVQSKPVEYYYRKQGKLFDFEVQGGLPQTWTRLLSALHIRDNDAIMQQQIPL